MVSFLVVSELVKLIQILEMPRQLRFVRHCLLMRAGACWYIVSQPCEKMEATLQR